MLGKSIRLEVRSLVTMKLKDISKSLYELVKYTRNNFFLNGKINRKASLRLSHSTDYLGLRVINTKEETKAKRIATHDDSEFTTSSSFQSPMRTAPK